MTNNIRKDVNMAALAFTDLPVDAMRHIFDKLPVRKVLQLELVSKQVQEAVLVSLKCRKTINFMNVSDTDPDSYDSFPYMTDYMLRSLLSKMPNLESIYNLTPPLLGRMSLHGDTLSLDGVMKSLKCLPMLKEVETNNECVLGEVCEAMPRLNVRECFSNQTRSFPPDPTHIYTLEVDMHVTQIHLLECCVVNLPYLGTKLKHIFLKKVRLMDANPFKDFDAPKLETFVMSHCMGTPNERIYVELLITLSKLLNLTTLELQTVPLFERNLLGNICQGDVTPPNRSGIFAIRQPPTITPFQALQSLSIGRCTFYGTEKDIHYGGIIFKTASLTTLRLEPVLLQDYMMHVLNYGSRGVYKKHVILGWRDTSVELTNEELDALGMSFNRCDYGSITDLGMRTAAPCTSKLETLEIAYCPYLVNPMLWHASGECEQFLHLRELTLKNCCSITLVMFTEFLLTLPSLEYLSLVDMFTDANSARKSEDLWFIINILKSRCCCPYEPESDTDEDDTVDSKSLISGTKLIHSRAVYRASVSTRSEDRSGVDEGQEETCRSLPVRKKGFVSTYKSSVPDCRIHIGSRMRQKERSCICIGETSTERALEIEHSHLTELCLDNVGFTDIRVVCPKMKSVSVSNCSKLRSLTFVSASDVTSVRVFECAHINDDGLMYSLSHQTHQCSRFVSLRPMRKLDIDSFSKEHMSDEHGSVFVFDYSPSHSETDYNVLRAESWLPLLEYLTRATRSAYDRPSSPLETRYQEKDIQKISGENDNSSSWTLITDVPWLKLLSDCPDVENRGSVHDPSAFKAGVYCREAKGHIYNLDVFNDLKERIETLGVDTMDLLQHTIITYVNMCDTDTKVSE